METTVIREEVKVYLQACQALAEFSRYIRDIELTPAEREAIETQMPALNFPRTPLPDDRPWRPHSRTSL
jgi:hypothetical protein